MNEYISRPFKMWIHCCNDPISNRLKRLGRYEHREMNFLRSIIKQGEIVADIGAHIGYYTLFFASRVEKQGKVIAIEPDVKNFHLLHRNVEFNHLDNVELHRIAITDKSDMEVLHIDKTNLGNNRLFYTKNTAKSYNIPTETIDNIIGDQRVDFIKMDIQGCEAEAYKGMQKTLAKNPYINMMVEFWPYGLRKRGQEPVTFLRELQKEFDVSFFHKGYNTPYPLRIREVRTFINQDKPDKFKNLFCKRRV